MDNTGADEEECERRNTCPTHGKHAGICWPCADEYGRLLASGERSVMRLIEERDRLRDRAIGAEAREAVALAREQAALADVARLTRALALARPFVEACAAEDVSYGFGGGDPLKFDPDPECSTDAERARHAADCEKARRGEPIDTKTGCHVEGNARVTYSGWGMGTYTYRDEEAVKALEAIDEALSPSPRAGKESTP